MAGSLVTNYFAQGTAASRPASPTAATGTLSFYFASDTEVLSFYDWNDAAWQDIAAFGGSEGIVAPQGRLTLTSATPVLTANVTGAGTVYYALYTGNMVPIYDGTSWANRTFTELSQALTDATKSPAAATTNSNYDMFVWNDSGTLRCTRGPAWTSDTGRGTGAGTTELTRVNGRFLNTNSITNGPAASRGLYVGTIRTNGTSTVDMYVGSTAADGGAASGFGVHVWNMYNRVLTVAENNDSTNSWAYTTATYRKKNNNSNNRVAYVQGISDAAIKFTAYSNSTNGSNQVRYTSVALDSETSNTSGGWQTQGGSNNTGRHQHVAGFNGYPGIGYHYLIQLEYSEALGTTTWIGDNGVAGEKWSPSILEIWA